MNRPLLSRLALSFALGASMLGISETSSAETMTVYKSPSCGCCEGWVKHMEQAGFDVEVHNLHDMNAIKQKVGLHPGLASCHTALVDGYVFEGHVPAQDIRRFLEEKPEAKGLAVPGMPAGENVPGMEVPGRRARFASYLIPATATEKQPGIYAVHE
ncbi:metal-binding protein [Hahella sp. CCB-MM4]|uniref:DUF411 domain-containing protein n=1 Tax=Hahella sp. (strain CCB-MM4) TaxID=1926491 RepID=UPI000BD68112|nr:DUF411 domain-containing protein [Hahella sp. CCB-MM4]OZG75343.1 metal-binding protein [Hahella sp. CCB-MM4]